MDHPTARNYRDRVIQFYAERAESYDLERSRNWTRVSTFRQEVSGFCRTPFLGSDPPSVVVDLGVGTGRTLPDSMTGRSKYIGVDLSLSMIRMLRQRFRHTIDIVCADIHQLPLTSEFAELAYLISVLQYLDINTAASEISRILRPGGQLILGVVCVHPEDVNAWRDRAFQSVEPPYLGRFRTADQVITRFKENGLVLIESRTLRYRRKFVDMLSDRSTYTEGKTLSSRLPLFASAPPTVRRLYEIDDEGFTQLYQLLRFRRAGVEN